MINSKAIDFNSKCAYACAYVWLMYVRMRVHNRACVHPGSTKECRRLPWRTQHIAASGCYGGAGCFSLRGAFWL